VSRGPYGASLRVVGAAGARGDSPALRQAQTVRALISVRPADARRETMGTKPYEKFPNRRHCNGDCRSSRLFVFGKRNWGGPCFRGRLV